MSASTKSPVAAVTIKDGTTTIQETHIDGKTLEEYFDAAGLRLEVDGYSLVTDGRRLNPTDVIRPGATITRAKNLRNG